MKMKMILLGLALGVSTCLLSAQDTNSAPAGRRPPPQTGGGPGGPGEFGGPPGGPGGEMGGPQAGFHLLPPRAMEQLNLTAEQQKKLTALEAEVKAKLEKILTAEQMQQLRQFRPPQRMGGPGGQGGLGGQGGQGPGRGQGRPGGQGGPGGDGGQGGPQRPPSE